MASFAESELLIAMIEAFGAPRPSSFGLGELQNALVNAISSGSTPAEVTIPFSPPGTYPALMIGPGPGWTSSKNSSTAPITKGTWNLAVPDNPSGTVKGLLISDTDTPANTNRVLLEVDDHTGAPIMWVSNAQGGVNATDNIRVLDGSLNVIARMVGPEFSNPGAILAADGTAALPTLGFQQSTTGTGGACGGGMFRTAPLGVETLNWATAGANRLSLNSTTFGPSTDASLPLGAASFRWSNVFAANGTFDAFNFHFATTALGGGAAPTLGTIGGSGPATAGQNSWLKVQINGTDSWIPIWR